MDAETTTCSSHDRGLISFPIAPDLQNKYPREGST